jgi:hypothetical protein
MSRLVAQFSLATPQGQEQIVFQPLKVPKFALYFNQFFFQSAAHRRTRLQAVSSQIQETAYLAELESQALHAAYESQRLDVTLAVLTVAPSVLAARGSKALRS